MCAELGARGALVAGGTDLFPKLKRRQMEPDTLVGLAHLRELRGVRRTADGGYELGGLVIVLRKTL